MKKYLCSICGRGRTLPRNAIANAANLRTNCSLIADNRLFVSAFTYPCATCLLNVVYAALILQDVLDNRQLHGRYWSWIKISSPRQCRTVKHQWRSIRIPQHGQWWEHREQAKNICLIFWKVVVVRLRNISHNAHILFPGFITPRSNKVNAYFHKRLRIFIPRYMVWIFCGRILVHEKRQTNSFSTQMINIISSKLGSVTTDDNQKSAWPSMQTVTKVNHLTVTEQMQMKG